MIIKFINGTKLHIMQLHSLNIVLYYHSYRGVSTMYFIFIEAMIQVLCPNVLYYYVCAFVDWIQCLINKKN
jgi:hypothetical protein